MGSSQCWPLCEHRGILIAAAGEGRGTGIGEPSVAETKTFPSSISAPKRTRPGQAAEDREKMAQKLIKATRITASGGRESRAWQRIPALNLHGSKSLSVNPLVLLTGEEALQALRTAALLGGLPLTSQTDLCLPQQTGRCWLGSRRWCTAPPSSPSPSSPPVSFKRRGITATTAERKIHLGFQTGPRWETQERHKKHTHTKPPNHRSFQTELPVSQTAQ